MRIGVPTEIKADETRVAIAPAAVRELTGRGHTVLVEKGAGRRAGFGDALYESCGAELVNTPGDVFERAEMVVKVKEPQRQEVAQLRRGQILFTYLHLAADPELAHALVDSGATCLAYETITDGAGQRPLLQPMSEIAGRLATHSAVWALQRPAGGPGLLPGGIAGVPRATIVIIGAGVVGTNAADVALGIGANVFILDRDLGRLREVEARFHGHCATVHADALAIEELAAAADVVIGAVLVPAARAPWVLDRQGLAAMKRGSILIDVSIDQGGCFETSRPTTHSSPTYELDGILHYCVANMPAAVPVTATRALTNATIPWILKLADSGLQRALTNDAALREGVNVIDGRVTCLPVARAAGLEAFDLGQLAG